MYEETQVIVVFDVGLFDFGWGVHEDVGCVLEIRRAFVRSFFICWWNWIIALIGLNYVVFPIPAISVAGFLFTFDEFISIRLFDFCAIVPKPMLVVYMP